MTTKGSSLAFVKINTSIHKKPTFENKNVNLKQSQLMFI